MTQFHVRFSVLYSLVEIFHTRAKEYYTILRKRTGDGKSEQKTFRLVRADAVKDSLRYVESSQDVREKFSPALGSRDRGSFLFGASAWKTGCRNSRQTRGKI